MISKLNSVKAKFPKKNAWKNLKTMFNGKIPGTDGLPVEFYKIFWNDLKDVLLSCNSHCFRTGQMAQSPRRGIITLIPKKIQAPFF